MAKKKVEKKTLSESLYLKKGIKKEGRIEYKKKNFVNNEEEGRRGDNPIFQKSPSPHIRVARDEI